MELLKTERVLSTAPSDTQLVLPTHPAFRQGTQCTAPQTIHVASRQEITERNWGKTFYCEGGVDVSAVEH